MAQFESVRSSIFKLLTGIIASMLAFASAQVAAAEIDITAAGSIAFGTSVTALPNGNVVVTDPNGPTANIGTVFLYTPSGVRISSFTGSSPNDHVGSGGVLVLADGNFVVVSPHWTNGTAANAGAVTWVNGSIGLSGVVSSDNSLIGLTAGDQVGSAGITSLSNGNYVIASPNWNSGSITSVGAATWANGNGASSGVVSPANSLVGSTANDQVGFYGATALSNGNYVVQSPFWSNGAATNAGAATWGAGSVGATGVVSVANSLVGSVSNDLVGAGGISALSNGNYVVGSSGWSNSAAAVVGAITWANGSTGIAGAVSPANSLVGTTAYDEIGSLGVYALTNGNYVVPSPDWNNGGLSFAGAVTWADGSVGIRGAVTAANSLVGTTSGDRVGYGGAYALTNGNYVVASYAWSNAGVAEAGAVTWANGATGISGPVSSTNSLVGSQTNDAVGGGFVTPLANGNYVVASPNWANGAATNAGAVTWASGTVGRVGPVSASNSLVGSSSSDFIGTRIRVLQNGNYLTASASWNNTTTGASKAGAVTVGNGNAGSTGKVSSANSLVGLNSNDQIGSGVQFGNIIINGIRGLSDDNFVVLNADWSNGAATAAGAITLASGRYRLAGNVAAYNSVRGALANEGTQMPFDYDPTHQQLLVGLPMENKVALFRMDQIFADGFE